MANFKIRTSKNGTHYYDVHHKAIGRKRKYGFRTKTEARTKALELLKELDRGITIDKEMTFVSYFDTWVKLHKESKVGDSQISQYERAKDFFIKMYGEKKLLNTITRDEIQLLLNEYGKGRSKETVRKMKNCLGAPLKDALYEGYITRDPTYNLEVNGTVPSMQERDKYITIEEYKGLIRFFKSGYSRSHLLLFILAITGARFSEVNKMTYNDLNYRPGKIWLPGTKTDTAPRAVSISPEDMAHINDRLAKRPRNITNKPFNVSHNAASKVYKRGLKKVGIDRYVRMYAMRHTHASLLIANNFDITYISNRLGHKTPKTTLDTYSHLLAEQASEQDRKLATLRLH